MTLEQLRTVNSLLAQARRDLYFNGDQPAVVYRSYSPKPGTALDDSAADHLDAELQKAYDYMCVAGAIIRKTLIVWQAYEENEDT